MKYYSEDLKKFYDSEEELVSAEKEAQEKKELAEVSRKEMAKKVDTANTRIKLAYENYEDAKKQVNEIVEEAKKKIKETIEPAKKEIKDAENERLEAIRDFNSKYGVYTETYTGDKAVEQYNRAVRHFNSIFENVWKPFSSWLF